MTSIRGKNKWPTSFCQAGHCCFYHILSTFLITGQKKGRMECIRFSWKLMHIQAVWYFSRKSNFFLLLIPTLVFPYSFSQTCQNDFTFQIWKFFFFFLTDTGFWRNREQSSMAKAGRPYFKRYETKITDHNVRIRRFFVRDYNVINSSQLYWHYLFARYTCARKHFSRIGAFFYYFNHCSPIVSAYLTYCCYGRINGNVRCVKSNIYSVCQSSRLSVVMTERSSYLSRPFLIEEFSSKQISSFL